MAISLVQSKSASGNSGSTASLTLTSASTAGNLLVMLVSAYKNPGDVTFTPPANWTQAGTTVHDDVFISISTGIYYYTNNPGSISSISTTLSTTVSAWHIEMMEFSGIATSSALDVTTAREQDHTTTPSSGAVTTTASGDLLIGWTEEDGVNGAYTLTFPGGWTTFSNVTDSGAWGTTYAAYQVAGAAGSYNWNPTLSNGTVDGIHTIAAFLAAGGGSGVTLSPTTGAGTGSSSSPALIDLLTVAAGGAGWARGFGSASTPTLNVILTPSGTAAGVGASSTPTLFVATKLVPATGAGIGVASTPVLFDLLTPLAAAGVGAASTPVLYDLLTSSGIAAGVGAASSATLFVATQLIATGIAAGLGSSPLATLGVAAFAVPGGVALLDTALAHAALTDQTVNAVTFSDHALAVVTISDKEMT